MFFKFFSVFLKKFIKNSISLLKLYIFRKNIDFFKQIFYAYKKNFINLKKTLDKF